MVQKVMANEGESFVVKKKSGGELNLIVPNGHILLMLPAKRKGKTVDVELGDETFRLVLS